MKGPNPRNRLLTREDVAQRLSVCPVTVARLTRSGKLPAIVFNKRRVRYEPKAVEDYIRRAKS